VEIIKSFRLNEQVAKNLDLQIQYTQLGYITEIQMWKNQPFEVIWEMDKDSLTNKSITFELVLNKTGFEIVNVNGNEYAQSEEHKYNEKIIVNNIPLRIVPKTDSNFEGQKFRVVLASLKNITRGLISSVAISNVGKESEILSLSMNGQNAAKTEAIINELIQVFDQDGVNDRQKVSERTINFVNERFVSLTRELDSIEKGKAGYKSKNSISFIEADAITAANRKEGAYDELLKMELQVELSSLLNNLLKAQQHQLLPGDIGLTNGEINKLIQDYNMHILEKDRIQKTAGEAHPTVIAILKRLDDSKANLKASIINYQNQLKTSKAQLERVNQESIGLYSKIPEKEKMVRAIERQQEIKESLYMILLTKREEAAINLAITEPSIKVVDYAITGTTPLSPKRSVTFLGAFMLGLLLPFGGLYLYFMSDTKVHIKDDLLAVIPQLTVAAEIPHLDKEKMVMDANDRSVLGEAFRILRTNISYLLPIQPDTSKAFVIFTTSTIKGEGKTFTSTNTAIAFTALNKKVLLIGADVRNPQLHKLLNADKNQKGLTNYLYDQKIEWQQTINFGVLNNPNLDVIFSGPIPPNPAELLSNGRLVQLLEGAKDMYDYIIVDTAPTILVTDTLLISQLADVTLYMVRANYTDKNLLNFIKELNEQQKLKNMAFVLNDIGAGKAYGYGYGYGYGYKYNYAYNYGYGYGYSEEVGGEKKKKSLLKRIFKA
jgi:capsular exopolysaccharide synthesis family protein